MEQYFSLTPNQLQPAYQPPKSSAEQQALNDQRTLSPDPSTPNK